MATSSTQDVDKAEKAPVLGEEDSQFSNRTVLVLVMCCTCACCLAQRRLSCIRRSGFSA
jgi:hypothetical protein